MSTVYGALDERLDREVAVKVMSSALSTDPAFADRFAREARIAARLSHPNAVSVYDQGTDDGHVFLVMELVRGRNLRDLLRERGDLSPAAAVSIMEPILGALAAAHRAGLVHRDIKPENILLADDGVVKVADFGLARAVEADENSTQAGLMMGTVAYCSPEQISRGAADPRSDVYSAGVMFFELLTGSAPYVGDTAMAVAYQHVNSDVPAPSSRRPGLPPQLDKVILRATCRERMGRPADASAFLAELHDMRVELGLQMVAVPPRPSSIDQTALMAPLGPLLSETNPSAVPFISATTDCAADALTGPIGSVARLDAEHHTTISARPTGIGPRPPASEDSTTQLSKSPQRQEHLKRSRRRAAIVIVLILLIGFGTGYGAWWVVVGRYHEVPNLVGQAQSAATSLLIGSGLAVNPSVDHQFSEQVSVGNVVATRPRAHSHVLGDKSVQLVLSKGPERYTIPPLAGRSLSDARSALRTFPVRVVTRQIPHDSVPAGQVIGTKPPQASSVKRDSVITVSVSTGPPIIAVPDVTNKPSEVAEEALTHAGFAMTSTEAFSDTVASGSVISQSPTGTAEARKASAVAVVLSKGPELVQVPDIARGTPLGQARATLKAAGFTVKVAPLAGAVIFGAVWSLVPSGGSQLPKGSEVTLKIV
jgi:serine/threonine-protein kinase